MTSTLQQEASRKLRFTAQTTMRVAQRLYESGYITYMRTDSTSLVGEPRSTAARTPGDRALRRRVRPAGAAALRAKVKNAQEAHEAIRPAGDRFRAPRRCERELDRDELGAVRADLEADARLADGGREEAETVSIRIGADVRPTAGTPSSASPAP